MARILLVRHGETALNSSQRFWGHTNVPLSSEGIQQAERLQLRLSTENINTVYTSNLSRAVNTAQTIISDHETGITVCPELREINFGEIEGLTFDEVNNSYPEVTRLWLAKSMELSYPGGESLKVFYQRVGSFLNRLEKHTENETILVVAHAGVLRTLICHLLNLRMKHWWLTQLQLASLSIIETYQEGAVLALLNDVCHLKESDNRQKYE